MVTNESQKIGIFCGKKLFVGLPFRNGLEYRNGDGQLKSALNVASTSCANTVMIGGVTPEKRSLIFVILYWPIISEHARLISTMIDIWAGMINMIFVSRSIKGRCYGNQLISI